MRIEIREKACRGCEMCVDICPTDVFSFDKKAMLAQIEEIDDCIACLSCAYICLSGAISHYDYHLSKNFYRDIDFSRRVGRFL